MKSTQTTYVDGSKNPDRKAKLENRKTKNEKPPKSIEETNEDQFPKDHSHANFWSKEFEPFAL